ncbi:MAG: response regulator, partial [Candidatus Aegiribacteria sp.]|nr:response regulator [Candidatus Aegiribacteria sp.]
ELIGKTDEDLFGSESFAHIRETDYRVLGGESIEEEHTIPVKGVERTFHVIKVPMYDTSGGITGICGIARDITDRKRLEDQLHHAHKMEAVGQLAGGVAHDFNNLLQVINGYAEMALGNLDPSHPVHGFIEEIARAGNRAGVLVSQLLSFSHRQIINPVDLDLNETINRLLKMIRRVIGEHIELDFIPGKELGTVHADRGQMEQVLTNLCVNSRDAMPEGGTITIEIRNVLLNDEYIKTHSWARPGRYILLSVTDTGCGMDEDTMNSVFDPFFTTKEVGKGTGLGLSTIYGIVKQHDGQIQVYSEVGKGTMFSIYLPAVEHSTAEVSSSVDSPVPGGTETILVAEDDDMVRRLTVQTLERAGYTVLDARNGKEAVRLFETHADEIALAVLDVVMPGLSGKQVHDRIKEIRPDVRVLFSSGYSSSAIHTRFVLDKGLQLIQKPYSPDDLIRRVREVLDTPEDRSSSCTV